MKQEIKGHREIKGHPLTADYRVKVMVPDMNDYQNFLLNKITRIQGGGTGVHSSFVLRQPIRKRL
ncbi:Lrp/AsnC ligand binding domain-containing protein [Endozoicomonas sp.]|uniref:Lrp/AsnC ligand binding domain-containing protein n=1 Tax=Endozoicomonas sp. TaxID=1892382 RepID=UPI00383AD0DA